jgi:microcystin-dependent protein
MPARLISIAKQWIGTPEIDTYIPILDDNANIEEAFKLFMYGNFDNGIDYADKSLYNFLVTFKNGIESNANAINGHAAQSNNVHLLGATGGDVVGTSKSQTLTNKTIENPIFTLSSAIPGPNLAPVGSIVMYGASAAPIGWLLCNGQSTAGYPALASVVGANVPDLMGRVPIGYGDSLDAAAPTNYNTMGAKFGTETHVLSINEMPSHNHPADLGDGLGSTNRTHYMDRNNVHAHGGDYVNPTTYRLYGSTYTDGNHLHYFTYYDATTNQGDGGTSGYRWDNSNDTQEGAVNIFTTNNASYGGHSHAVYVDYNTSDVNHRHTIQAQGGGVGHENRQPSTVVQFIIKY